MDYVLIGMKMDRNNLEGTVKDGKRLSGIKMELYGGLILMNITSDIQQIKEILFSFPKMVNGLIG